MDKPALPSRDVKTATLITGVLAVLFVIFFNTSKHDPALAQANVFIDDPYDAVGSFGVQLVLLAALLSLVRILRPYPRADTLAYLPGPTPSNLLLILRGDAVALLSIAITLAADGVAMLRFLPAWTGSAAGWRLALLAVGLFLLAALAGGMVFDLGRRLKLLAGPRAWGKSLALCLAGFIALAVYPQAWRDSIPGSIFTALAGMAILFVLAAATVKLVFPPGGVHPEDVLDDLLAHYRWIKAHARPAGFVFDGIEKAAAISPLRRVIQWLNPRQHAWNFVLLAAVGMGIAFLLIETLGEGAPNRNLIMLVAAVFIGIEGAGVLLGYALFRQYLGIFRVEGIGNGDQ
jgi:hypothetical protein